MALKIQTFSNVSGGSSLFKALSHPLAAPRALALIEKLRAAGPIAVYDPYGYSIEFDSLYDLSSVAIDAVYVQKVVEIGAPRLGHHAKPVTAMKDSNAKVVFVASYDVPKFIQQFRHLLPKDAEVLCFDELRLPDDMLTNKGNYLDNLNFATNFVYFREQDGHHTRLFTANFWAGYKPTDASLWLCLFDADGKVLAQWKEHIGTAVSSITIDSKDVKKKFGLGAFTGSLFFHGIGVAGHETVKYALDTYGDDDTVLSCTHDANSFPADFYAGLPAPKKGEKVTLIVQNSHPCPIPANAIGLNLMGANDTAKFFDQEIAPYGTCAIDVSNVLPAAAWPQQIEVQAGRYFVRPRYEVVAANGRRRMAHANVERTDLKPDPEIPGLGNLMGKGFILPAPILPMDRWDSIALPTPMATEQHELPLALLAYDKNGVEILRQPLGKILRKDSTAINVSELLKGKSLPGGFGHMELVYDFHAGTSVDGWLHGLFRYEDRNSGHAAETSFGAHVFNTVLVYKNQPQSYTGRVPGLSTRLFLRLGPSNLDTMCHLVYPASTPWHEKSQTDIILFDKHGTEHIKKTVNIACGGSLLWRYSEMFTEAERKQVGDGAYAMIRDTTCRLFGYHGLLSGEKAFSFDHMFGF